MKKGKDFKDKIKEATLEKQMLSDKSYKGSFWNCLSTGVLIILISWVSLYMLLLFIKFMAERVPS